MGSCVRTAGSFCVLTFSSCLKCSVHRFCMFASSASLPITSLIDATLSSNFPLSRKFGLMINAEKTKKMVVERRKETPLSIKLLSKYNNLSTHALGNKCRWVQRKAIEIRIGHTSQAFGMETKIWKSRELTKKTKINIYETLIQLIFLYGSECWASCCIL